MAKSFKNNNSQLDSNLPDSKKDIIDFFEEDKKLSNIGVTPKVTPINSLIKKPVLELDNETEEVRQTFIIGKKYLESIKDYVHYQRTKGNYEYSQRNVLEDALNLLFKVSDFTERPDSVKQKESERSRKIKQGIRS